MALLEPDSLVVVEFFQPLNLPFGDYVFEFSASSANDTLGSPTFYDNSDTVYFNITIGMYTGYEYSVDGIGVHPNQSDAYISTNDYPQGEDGLTLCSKFVFHSTSNYSDLDAIRLMLAPNTIPGGEVYSSIKEVAPFLNGELNSLIWGGPSTITAQHIASGFVDVCFSIPINVSSGTYYACVELYSNGSATPIYVVDDTTIVQPPETSAVNIIGDSTFLDGNALGIRLLRYCLIGINEISASDVQILPNPADEEFRIFGLESSMLEYKIQNSAGEIIKIGKIHANESIDISYLNSGVYFVHLHSKQHYIVKKLLVK